SEESANNEKVEGEDNDAPLSVEELVCQLLEILSSATTHMISDAFFMYLIDLVEDARHQVKDFLRSIVEVTSEEGVRVETIDCAKDELQNTIKLSSLESEVQDALYELVDFAIVENSFDDV